MMPEMSGIEATAKIRGLGDEDPYFSAVPIIALTANAVSGTKEMFLANGFNDFLSKPIDIVKLEAIIEKWVPQEKQVMTEDSPAHGAVNERAPQENLDGISLEISGLNTRTGLMMAGGSIRNYLNILHIFHKDGRKKIKELKACLATDNLPLYRVNVHALKSAAANIGAEEFSAAAQAMEIASEQGDTAYIEAHSQALLRDLEALLDHIHTVLEAEATQHPDGPPENQAGSTDSELLKTDLTGLKSALAAMDAVTIKQTVSRLKTYVPAPDAAAVIDSISQYVLIGDYEKAEASIAAYLRLSSTP
jgi:CheY-like chemotaxis protein